MVDWADDDVGASHNNNKMNTLPQDSAAVERSRLRFMTGGRARGDLQGILFAIRGRRRGPDLLLGCKDEQKVAGGLKTKKKRRVVSFLY